MGSTSAINTDKTGTLTLNQMTAVQMAVAGRRYAVEGEGLLDPRAHHPRRRTGGVPLDEFLMPMVLASDAVLSDGELIGDRPRGAWVALAARAGIDAVSTRQAYPRIAELPFDAAYKLMATFHRMTDESGKAAIRCCQGRARSAPGPRRHGAEHERVPFWFGHRRACTLAQNRRLGEQGLRVMATARRDFDPATFDPGAELLPLGAVPPGSCPGRDRRPAAPRRQGSVCAGEVRRDQGPHDHR